MNKNETTKADFPSEAIRNKLKFILCYEPSIQMRTMGMRSIFIYSLFWLLSPMLLLMLLS